MDLYYDLQKNRIELGNRIGAIERAVSAEGESESDVLAEVFEKAKDLEKSLVPIFKEYASGKPGSTWLLGVRGIGPVLSANLVATYGDCSRFGNVSKLWAWTGLSVVDGKAQKRKAGVKSNWNAKAKVLAWKIATSFEKQPAAKCFYRAFYDKAKSEYAARPDLNGASGQKGWKGHVRNMALRKTVKLFLSHYWESARKDAGLATGPSYAIGISGHAGHIPPGEAEGEPQPA